MLVATTAMRSGALLRACSGATNAIAGLAADEDVFDLIKQEVQRDAQVKKKRPAGKLQLLTCPCAIITQHHLADVGSLAHSPLSVRLGVLLL